MIIFIGGIIGLIVPSTAFPIRPTLPIIFPSVTKDARTYTSHTPGSHEPRTQTLRISRRDKRSSYAIKSSIVPASLSSGCFKTRHRATAHKRSTLSEPAHTWYKRKADAFAPATHVLQTLNVRIKISGKPASNQNRTLSDVLRMHHNHCQTLAPPYCIFAIKQKQ